MRRSFVALALVVLALAGCAEQHPAGPPPPSGTSESATVPTGMPTPAPTASAGGGAVTVHRGTPPAGTPRGPAWEALSTPDPAATSVEIGWWDSPSPDCGAVRDVWVRETSTAVVIDLVRSPRRLGIMCPAVLVPRRANVPLRSPLGSRTLQQGASSPNPSPSTSAG
jgi:hypothetical protein